MLSLRVGWDLIVIWSILPLPAQTFPIQDGHLIIMLLPPPDPWWTSNLHLLTLETKSLLPSKTVHFTSEHTVRMFFLQQTFLCGHKDVLLANL